MRTPTGRARAYSTIAMQKETHHAAAQGRRGTAPWMISQFGLAEIGSTDGSCSSAARCTDAACIAACPGLLPATPAAIWPAGKVWTGPLL
jgi:hypothetical protein